MYVGGDAGAVEQKRGEKERGKKMMLGYSCMKFSNKLKIYIKMSKWLRDESMSEWMNAWRKEHSVKSPHPGNPIPYTTKNQTWNLDIASFTLTKVHNIYFASLFLKMYFKKSSWFFYQLKTIAIIICSAWKKNSKRQEVNPDVKNKD